MLRRLALVGLIGIACSSVGGAADPPVAVDRHGFPLPAGALARFGSSRLRYGGGVHGLDLTPDGKTVVTAGYTPWVDGTEVRLWDAATGNLVRSFDYRWARGVAVSADGTRVAVHSGNASFWDLSTGKRLWDYHRGQGDQVSAVAVAPDGKLVAVAGDKIALIDAASGELVRTIGRRQQSNSVGAVVFSPDGTLVAAEDLYEVRLWEAATGRVVRTMDGRQSVNGLAFTPDGKQLLATLGWDATVPVWDVATGKRVRTLKGHAGDTCGLAVSKDGRFAATGGGTNAANRRVGPDHTIRIWNLRADTPPGCCRGPTTA